MGGWGEEGEGDISMNSTVLKKKRFILTFQNWQVETLSLKIRAMS